MASLIFLCFMKTLYFLKMCNSSDMKISQLTKYELVNISAKFDQNL